MPLNLEHFDHVVYAHQHLSQVLTQLRFNPILKIGTETPAEFQDVIREAYPIVDGRPNQTFVLTIGNVPADGAPNRQTSDWKFMSADRKWTVTLSQNFLAFATTEYADFNDFSARLRPVFDALMRVYKVPFFTRVGLRYTNTFPYDDGASVEYLAMPFRGLWASSLAPNVKSGRAEFILEDGIDQVGVRVGTITTKERPQDGQQLLLDFDHFREGNVEPADVVPLLHRYHDVNYQLFRNAIATRLHDEMEPQDG